MQPDPIAGSIINPQSLNHYSYTSNDPVNFTDPLGLNPEAPIITLSVTESFYPDSYYWFIWRSIFGGISATGGGDPGGQGGGGQGGQPISQNPQNNKDCFNKIAQLFGGPGAVGGDHGAPPSQGNLSTSRDPRANPTTKAHVYPNANGTGATNIYMPGGYEKGVFSGGNDGTAYFVYGDNGPGNLKNVVLLVNHLKSNGNFPVNTKGGSSVFVGTTGGLDGGKRQKAKYQHIHLEVFKGQVLPPLIEDPPGRQLFDSDQIYRNAARIPYRDVFCK